MYDLFLVKKKVYILWGNQGDSSKGPSTRFAHRGLKLNACHHIVPRAP